MLRLNDVSYAWVSRTGRHPAVGSVTAEFAPGVSHVLCGPSGSGKTTLSLLLAGLIAPDSGTVLWDDRPVAARRAELAYVFQFPEGIFFEDSVRAELEWMRSQGQTPKLDAFEQLGLSYSELADRHPYHLSAGFGRLTAVALQLAREPRLLIVDEPTIGLDWLHHARMAKVLREWPTPDRMLIVVTHDLELMRVLGGQAWVMAERTLAWSGATATLLDQPDLLRRYGLEA